MRTLRSACPIFQTIFLAVVSLGLCVTFLVALPETAQARFCWKSTHSRGIGTVPTACGPGREYDAGLCYDNCKAGYNGVGPVCWQRCPDGFRNDGAFCGKPSPIGRGRGLSKRNCEREFGSGNCVKEGLLWYRRCPSGYREAGVLLCSPTCPSGMSDIGVSCAKQSYGRGVGTVPQSCPAGQDLQAGLCYRGCKKGYTGVGPVCWSRCPDGMVDCGAGCATTRKECRGVVKEQVIASLKFIANVATLMTSGKLTADQVDQLVNDALYDAVNELKEQFIAEVKDAAVQVGANITTGTYEGIEDLLRDLGGRIDIDWAKIDPTGIYELVEKFNHEICDLPSWAQEEEAPPQPIKVHLAILGTKDSDKDTCPKTYELSGYIQYPGHKVGEYNTPATARYRIVHNGKYSELRTEQTEEVLHPYEGYMMNVVYVKERVHLDHGKHEFRLEVRGSDKKGEAAIEVKCPPFEVIRAELHFSPAKDPVCPQRVLTRTIFATTRPGMVEYRRERQGGPPSGWLKIESKPLAGQYQAFVDEVQNVGEIDQVRRVVAKRWANKPGTIASAWVPFRTHCLDVLDQEILIDGPVRGTCPLKNRVRVRFNTDMEGPVSYRVDCNNGASFAGTAQAKSTGPGTYIAVASDDVVVRKSGKLVCALKIKRRADKGFQPATLRGKDFTCRHAGSSDLVPESTPPGSQGTRTPERVADPPRSCPPGTAGKWPNCRRQTCPRGTTGTWPDCKQRSCPKGTVGNWPNCRRQTCPRGTVGKWPNCKKRGCPPGQALVRGRCIKPAG